MTARPVLFVPVQARREQLERPRPVTAGWAAGLDLIAATELDRLGIEADYPGWKVSLLEHDGYLYWTATGDSGYRPVLRADSPGGLRSALGEFLA